MYMCFIEQENVPYLLPRRVLKLAMRMKGIPNVLFLVCMREQRQE